MFGPVNGTDSLVLWSLALLFFTTRREKGVRGGGEREGDWLEAAT